MTLLRFLLLLLLALRLNALLLFPPNKIPEKLSSSTSPRLLEGRSKRHLFLQRRSLSSTPPCRLWAATLTAATTQTTQTTQHQKQEDDTISSFPQNDFEEKSPDNVLWPSRTPTIAKRGGGTCFPMSLVVNHDEIKQALLVAATCASDTTSTSTTTGVLIAGRRGTCKSVIARSLQGIVPAFIKRVKGNPFNIDPRGGAKGGVRMDSILAQTLLLQQKQESANGGHAAQASSPNLEDLETELVETPFVTVPLGVQEDALVGSVDLEKSLETGQTVFQPGILAKAHRGILYVDEINLLEDEVASLLFQCLADGFVQVEREGLSIHYPCQPLVFIATYNPAEGELREHLVDRFAIQLSADYTNNYQNNDNNAMPLSDRVQTVLNVEAWLDASDAAAAAAEGSSTPSKQQRADRMRQLVETAQEQDAQLRETVQRARELLPQVQISRDQLLYLCETSTRADCEGQRAEVFATMAAKASAALGNRLRVNAKDLELGVLLAIAPRARAFWGPTSEDAAEQQQEEQAVQPPPPPPPPTTPEEQQQLEPQEMEEQEPEEKPEEDQEDEEEIELEIPLEFMFGVDSTPIDPRLLVFHKNARKGRGGKRSRKFNIQRGRFVKAIFPRGVSTGHLAVGATLRAAAPFQLSRRRRFNKRLQGDRRAIFIDKDDFRIKQMKKKTGNLIIFVVDASGSMALNRMSAAKGAAINLLQEAYKSRDKVALLAFHGDASSVVVPPTKAMALAKKRLEGMPCGSRTPLADALTSALRIGLNAIKVKQDTGKVIIVLISDGRANVPLCVSQGDAFDPSIDPYSKEGIPSRNFLKDEVMAISKVIGANDDFDLLVIDTEDKFVSTGIAQELARVARGNYYHLARADSKSVSRVVQQATSERL